MVGGIISYLIRTKSMDHAIKTGLKAAYCSLQSPDTVSHDLSPNQFLTREWLELEPKFQIIKIKLFFTKKIKSIFLYLY